MPVAGDVVAGDVVAGVEVVGSTVVGGAVVVVDGAAVDGAAVGGAVVGGAVVGGAVVVDGVGGDAGGVVDGERLLPAGRRAGGADPPSAAGVVAGGSERRTGGPGAGGELAPASADAAFKVIPAVAARPSEPSTKPRRYWGHSRRRKRPGRGHPVRRASTLSAPRPSRYQPQTSEACRTSAKAACSGGV